MKRTNPLHLYKKLVIALAFVAAIAGGALFFMAQNEAKKNAISPEYSLAFPQNTQEGPILYSSGGQTKIPANCLDRSVSACSWSDNVNTLTLARNDFSFDFVDIKNKTVKSISNTGQTHGVKTALIKNTDGDKLLMVATAQVGGEKTGAVIPGLTSLIVFDPHNQKPIQKLVSLPVAEAVPASYSISPDLNKLFIAQSNRAKIWDITKASTTLDEKCFGLTAIYSDWARDSSGVAFVLNNEVFFRSEQPGECRQNKMMDGQNCEWWRWVDPDKIAIATTFIRKMQVLHYNVSKSEVSMESRGSVKSEPKTFLTATSRAGFGHVKMILRQNSHFFEAREADKCCEEFICDLGSAECEAKYSPDGNYLCVTSGRKVIVFSEAKEVVAMLAPERFANAKNPPQRVSVEWSPESSTVVVLGGGNSGTIEIIDVLNADTSSR